MNQLVEQYLYISMYSLPVSFYEVYGRNISPCIKVEEEGKHVENWSMICLDAFTYFYYILTHVITW